MTFNQRFKFVRNLLHMNQKQFADTLKIDQGSVSNVETGKTLKPSKRLLRALEETFGVNNSYMEFGVDPIFLPNTEHKRKSGVYDLNRAEKDIAQITSFHEDVWNNEVDRLKLDRDRYKQEAEINKMKATTYKDQVDDLRERIIVLQDTIKDLKDQMKNYKDFYERTKKKNSDENKS